jgi:NAD(P)-dependent dehydrogenase (short-subunit alcohol dehydrogenase family)
MKIETLFSVQDLAVVVTGGSSGIGYMIAEGFVANGARVFICARNAQKCTLAAAALRAQGECVAIPADLTTLGGRQQLVERVTQETSTLNVLINNAGVARNTEFEGFAEADYDKVMDTNLKAPFFLTGAFLPLLRAASRSGAPARVINVGSNDGLRVPKPEQRGFAYGPSKAALHHLTRVLALRYGPEQITVNAIAPGPFESEMMQPVLARYRSEIEGSCPLRRIGKPSDMAGVAIYLASAAASYVTGAVIPVDGGNTLA